MGTVVLCRSNWSEECRAFRENVAGGAPLDCVVRLVTPERIVIEHPLAGPSRRFVAYLVDQVLLVVLVLLAVLLFPSSWRWAHNRGSGRH